MRHAEYEDKDYATCCGLGSKGCTRFWQVFTLIVVILTLACVMAGTVLTTQKDSVHRISVRPSAALVRPAGAGEGAYESVGLVTLNENDNSIAFTLRVAPGMTGVTAIHIRGPIGLLSPTFSGPIAGVLCGAVIGPGDGCDTTSTPGEISGTVAYQIADNAHANGVDLRPVIHAIRADPHLYYLEVLTNGKPVSPGALRDALDRFAGWS